MKIYHRNISIIILLSIGVFIFIVFIYNKKIGTNKCNQFPRAATIEKVLREHQDIITRIEQINPGYIYIEITLTECPGRAFITIYYGTNRDKKTIQKILGNDLFFGIPYALKNS